LPNQHGQILAALQAEVLLAAVDLEVAAGSAVALAQRQLTRVAEFDQHPLSGVRTLPAEVSADQVQHLDSITVVIAWRPYDRMDSRAHSLGPQTHMSAGPLRLLGSQTG
jgi:hypothetical protein